MMMRRSAFRKSCGRAASEGPGTPSHSHSESCQECRPLPQAGHRQLLTDCIQEKKRAGRFSPKKIISEVETDRWTQRQKETVTREADTEQAGIGADLMDMALVGHSQDQQRDRTPLSPG